MQATSSQVGGLDIRGGPLTGSCSSNPGGVQNPRIGSVVHFGATDSNSMLWVTQCPGILMLTMGSQRLGMYFRLDAGPPASMEIRLVTVPGDDAIFFATPYPAGTTFNSITVVYPWSNSAPRDLASVGSVLAAATDTSGFPVYYWDNNILYIKLVDPVRIGMTTGSDYFTRGNPSVEIPYAFPSQVFGWPSATVWINANLGPGSANNADSNIPGLIPLN